MGASQSNNMPTPERVTGKDLGMIRRIRPPPCGIPDAKVSCLANGSTLDVSEYASDVKATRESITSFPDGANNGYVKVFVVHCNERLIDLDNGKIMPEGNSKAKPYFFVCVKSNNGARYSMIRPQAESLMLAAYLNSLGIQGDTDLNTSHQWLNLDEFSALATYIKSGNPVTCGFLAPSTVARIVGEVYPKGWVIREIPYQRGMQVVIEAIKEEVEATAEEQQSSSPTQ